MIIDSYDIRTGNINPHPASAKPSQIILETAGAVEAPRWVVRYTGQRAPSGNIHDERVLYNGPDPKRASELFNRVVANLEAMEIKKADEIFWQSGG